MNSTSSNSTVTVGWTSSPDGRGTNDIILTCIFTIVLCCWTSVCPNLPALSDGRWAQIRDKLDLTCIGLLGPEFLLMIAVGQRSSARRSLKVCDSIEAFAAIITLLTDDFYRNSTMPDLLDGR